MLLKYFYDEELAQASYMVGCAANGEALIIDPARDVTPYIKAAAQEGLRITQISETHIHADFVSGSRELAAQTGAVIYLSEMGDDDWQYGFADEQEDVILVRDGDSWMIGNIKVEVIHTPGHTPEHIALQITDTAGADQPIGVFTGDFLFVGDVGRPDLLEEAAGMFGTKETGAKQQYHSVARFKEMPDYLQIWPGHGAGSACGKALGAIPSTTLGYEKLFNPAFQFETEAPFVDWLLSDQPEAPRYFAQMKQVNKAGPALLSTLRAPVRLEREKLEQAIAQDGLALDLRAADDYNREFLPGTLNIPATANNFSTYVGWFYDYSHPLYLIVPDVTALSDLLSSLRAIGIDEVAGYAGPDVLAGATEQLTTIDAATLAERRAQDDIQIIDVRGRTEYRDQHIVGAHNILLGELPAHLDEIPRSEPVVTQCTSGYRAQIAASLLRAEGFEHVIVLDDTEANWNSHLETVEGEEPVVA